MQNKSFSKKQSAYLIMWGLLNFLRKFASFQELVQSSLDNIELNNILSDFLGSAIYFERREKKLKKTIILFVINKIMDKKHFAKIAAAKQRDCLELALVKTFGQIALRRVTQII